VKVSVEAGSAIRTNDWTGYQGLETKGYRHEVIPIKRSGKQAHELLSRVHKVISLFKRWLMGMHQGAISHEHLTSYLNEFVLWFNWRTSAHRGKLFLRLPQQAVVVDPVTYAGLIKGVRKGRYQKHKVLG
jgi:hypothetical protein